MSGPHAVRPTVLTACEAWRLAGDEADADAAAAWIRGNALLSKIGRSGIDMGNRMEHLVWVDGRIGRRGDWIVWQPTGTLVLSAEEFAAAWEVVP